MRPVSSRRRPCLRARRCGSPWSAPVSGGAGSTRNCSPPGPTPRSSRWSAGTATARPHEPPTTARTRTSTWKRGPHANLIETQCHGLDMLEHLCGPIESVMAEATNPGGTAWSTLSVALRFSAGAVGSLVGSYDSSYAYEDTHRLELNGTGGRILVQ